MDKILYLVAGANGSGKTTFARNLVKDTRADFLNADDIMLDLGVGATQIQAGKEYFTRLKSLMKNNLDVVIETTLSGRNHNRIIEILSGILVMKYACFMCS